MTQLLLGDESDIYPRFRERIKHLTTHARHIGWGHGDELEKLVFLLEDELGGGDRESGK